MKKVLSVLLIIMVTLAYMPLISLHSKANNLSILDVADMKLIVGMGDDDGGSTDPDPEPDPDPDPTIVNEWYVEYSYGPNKTFKTLDTLKHYRNDDLNANPNKEVRYFPGGSITWTQSMTITAGGSYKSGVSVQGGTSFASATAYAEAVFNASVGTTVIKSEVELVPAVFIEFPGWFKVVKKGTLEATEKQLKYYAEDSTGYVFRDSSYDVVTRRERELDDVFITHEGENFTYEVLYE